MKNLLLLLGIFAGAVQGASFYVDAQAAAGGDGSRAKPWRSPAEAIEGVRQRTANASEPVRIQVRAGDYVLPQALRFTRKDGGRAGAPVEWCGEARSTEKGRTRFMFGVPVAPDRFKKVSDEAILARLPESARGKVLVADVGDLLPEKVPEMSPTFGGTPSAPLLFVNHELATLARWPNEGFTSFTERVEQGDDKHPGAFVYNNPRAKRWNFAEGVWLNGYWTHDWDNRSVKAASYGEENGRTNVLRLAAMVPYGVMGGTWGAKERRFYAFNLLDELDAPGEWWLDRVNKRLYLYPPKEILTAKDEVVIACGQGPKVQIEADHLHFSDICFEYAYDSMVSAVGDDLVFNRCTIANLGGTGISLRGSRNRLVASTVFNTGRNAVSVNGGDRQTLTRSDSLVADCHIHHFGIFQRTYAPGISVHGCGMTLRGNTLHDAPHSAVLYGGNEHLFESNEVYAVLLETGDAGAYYTGRDWTTMGNVLRGNYTHDLGSGTLDHANTMGFYFDDCDCGDAVYDNVFHNVARGIMIGGGREHPVKGNVFSNCRIGLSIDCRGMTWKHWNSREHGGDSWLLEDKAKALNYTEGVWASRYPLLAKIMQDHPREPLYNPVEDNIFIDCTQEILALDGTASQCLERMAPIRNNTVYYTHGTNGVKTAKIDARIKDGFRVVEGRPASTLGGKLP